MESNIMWNNQTIGGTCCLSLSYVIGLSLRGRGSDDLTVCWGKTLEKGVVENQRRDRLGPSQLWLPSQSTTDLGARTTGIHCLTALGAESLSPGINGVGSF